MKAHLAELLLAIKLRGLNDRFRVRHAFASDIEATHAILFSPKYSKRMKISAYRKWLETNQPCVFGRVAAKNKNVFICLLEEHEILRMKRGDEDLRDTIQDYRQVWKRHALEGLSSSFLVLLVSKGLVSKEPNDYLKEICRRLLELYMEVDKIEDDTYQTQREYVFLRRIGEDSKPKILKFSTLPNIFCAQGDGRWWHDHRTPGGIMITSNALGHFVYSRAGVAIMQDKDKVLALENAMRTINNAHKGISGNKSSRLKHCPATFLIPIQDGETSPLKETSDFRKYSPDHYQGYFHADHLIPSVFFTKDRDPKSLKLYDNLTFRYIYDPSADPDEHAELMTGVQASWYDVKRNMDRLPDSANPENASTFSPAVRGRLAKWLDQRLKDRLES
jgi:hypothetical protein